MASGVAVNDCCKELCQQVKMNLKNKQKYRYAVLKISDDFKEIVVDEERKASTETGEGQCFFDGLIKDLPSDDGRYIIYDYVYDDSFGKTSKVILVMWCPQGIPIKKKMLYASSKDALKKAFPDLAGEFQADCPADLDHTDIVQKLRK